MIVAIDDHALLIEVDQTQRSTLEEHVIATLALAQVGVELHELTGAEVHGVFEHRAVRIELAIRAVHRLQKAAPLGGRRKILAEALLELSPEQIVHLLHAHTSESVVIVIVWLWSSLRTPGLKGDISP